MSETVILWLIGGIAGFMFVVITPAAIAFAFLLSQRVTKLETWFEVIGDKALRSMFREDDKFGMDYYVKKYVERNFDLPKEDWIAIRDMNRLFEEDDTKESNDRFRAGLVVAFAEHKLQQYGITPEVLTRKSK